MMGLQALEVKEIGVPLSVETQRDVRTTVDRARSEVSTACFVCGAESLNNLTCCYCWRTYCEVHWYKHMAWEKANEGLAEEYARMWTTESAPRRNRS